LQGAKSKSKLIAPQKLSDQITKFQTSSSIVIKRTDIINAPYNPRKISEEALKELRKNIRRVGLLGGIVINKQTMHIVSGHQRLKALDQIEGTQEYNIRVDMVDMDEKTEKEQNIFMNNQSVMGEFDLDSLRHLIPDIEYENAGLDIHDLNILGVAEVVSTQQQQQIHDDILDIQKPTEEKRQQIKDLKKNIKNQIENKIQEGDPLVLISFDSFDKKAAFMQRFGYDINQKYIKGEHFGQIIERIE